MSLKIHIGFDDTDSPRMGCTTYIAALLIEGFRELGVSSIDYPNLVRLNPNVPWKTRGNGALSLRILGEEQLLKDIKEYVVETIEEYSDLNYDGTEPGVVFLYGEVPSEIEAFAQNAIRGIVKKDEASSLIKRFKAEAVVFKKGRGIVGGLAAIGERLRADHTFELIAYRRPENRGSTRRIDSASVIKMGNEMGRFSFNNVDPETGRILITPRGPDPILYGIRGESSEVVKRGHELIISEEPVERWVVFRTNQGTDAHLTRAVSISEVKPFNPCLIKGEVIRKPTIIQGGHVIFQIKDDTGQIYCAAYQQTGRLRDVAKMLIVGDFIEAYGGVRPFSARNPLTVNLEKIRIIKLAPFFILTNPLCPVCGKRTKSDGKGQGFKCKKCDFHGPKLKKTILEAERVIEPGVYITSPRSQRHLTKPRTRYGLEKAVSFQCSDKIVPYELFSSS